MEVNAREVARLAGVSESTVSRALAGSPVVAASTRERVRQVADELGYTARSANSSSRTGSIGIIVPDIGNPFFAAMSKFIRSSAQANRLRATIMDSDEDVRNEREAAIHLAGQVDAMVLCSPRSGDDDLVDLARQAPTVLTSRVVEGVPTIGIDESYSMGRVLAHLRALNHKRIAYVGGPVASTSEIARRAALVAAAATDEEIDVIRVTNVSASVVGGMGAADEVLATGATAVIAFNDMVALGLMARVSQRGLRVPEDISVVGFDDVLVAEAAFPQLTTVAMPLRAVGASTVGLIQEWLETGSVPRSPAPLQAELIVRSSTAVASR